MPDSPWHAKRIRLGEVDCGYSEGPSNGPKLVILHGVTGSRHTWDPVLPCLMERFQVFAVDHRGHGLSSHHSGRYHIDYMVGDLSRFIRSVAEDPVYLLGHSMGARIALSLTAAYPDLVRAMALEDPPLDYGPSIQAIRPFFEFLLSLKKRNLGETAMCREITNYHGSENPESFRYKAQTLRQMDGEIITLLLDKKLWPGDGWNQEMSQVTCPARLLQADTQFGGVMDEDLSTVPELRADNWQWKRYPGIGHSIHAELPAEFSRDVISFFAETQSRVLK